MGLIRLVRECTDFPIHKHAAHVIRKVDRHPVTGKWRAEGWKTGEQLRFRHQIRRVLGSRVDINRLFERLEPRDGAATTSPTRSGPSSYGTSTARTPFPTS